MKLMRAEGCHVMRYAPFQQRLLRELGVLCQKEGGMSTVFSGAQGGQAPGGYPMDSQNPLGENSWFFGPDFQRLALDNLFVASI